MNGVATPQGKWQKAKDPNGKTYYYHVDTKQSSWTNPEETGAAPAAAVSLRHIVVDSERMTNMP